MPRARKNAAPISPPDVLRFELVFVNTRELPNSMRVLKGERVVLCLKGGPGEMYQVEKISPAGIWVTSLKGCPHQISWADVTEMQVFA